MPPNIQKIITNATDPISNNGLLPNPFLSKKKKDTKTKKTLTHPSYMNHHIYQ